MTRIILSGYNENKNDNYLENENITEYSGLLRISERRLGAVIYSDHTVKSQKKNASLESSKHVPVTCSVPDGFV